MTRYLWTGREFDTLTGLQYNRNRWYDPGLGRWLSEDPIRRINWQNGTTLGQNGWHAGLVLTAFADGANPHIYTDNSPTNETDPTGMSGFWSDYWYYFTNPWSMDRDLRYGQYCAYGMIAVGTIGAIGVEVAGVGGITIIGGGGAIGGGTIGGGAIGSGEAVLIATYNETLVSLLAAQKALAGATAANMCMSGRYPDIFPLINRVLSLTQQLEAMERMLGL